MRAGELDGEKLHERKGRAFGIGASFKYDNRMGFFVTDECQMRNRVHGKAFWGAVSLLMWGLSRLRAVLVKYIGLAMTVPGERYY